MPPVLNSVTVLPAETPGSAPRIAPDEQTAELQRKVHRSVLAVVEKMKKNEPLSSSDGPIREGKAELQVWLTDKTDETLKQLKELGFEIVLDVKSSKIIIGRLPVEKIETLAKFKVVRYVVFPAIK